MNELLTELFLLTQIEREEELTEEQKKRYVQIVEYAQLNKVEIPFPVTI